MIYFGDLSPKFPGHSSRKTENSQWGTSVFSENTTSFFFLLICSKVNHHPIQQNNFQGSSSKLQWLKSLNENFNTRLKLDSPNLSLSPNPQNYQWSYISILELIFLMFTLNTALWANSAEDKLIFFLYFLRRHYMKCLASFSGKHKKNISKCCLMKIFPSMLSVKIRTIFLAILVQNFNVHFTT